MNAAKQNGSDAPKRKPDPVDVLVGSRLRNIRISAGMSQEDLGHRLGVSFQQVQKYERGTNRISSSMLYRMSQILHTGVADFFTDVKNMDGMQAQGEALKVVLPLGTSRTDIEMFKLYQSIESEEVRRKLVQMMRLFLKQ